MINRIFLALIGLIISHSLVAQNMFSADNFEGGTYTLSEYGKTISMFNIPSEVIVPTVYGLKRIKFDTQNKIQAGKILLINGYVYDSRVESSTFMNSILSINRETSDFTILFEDHDGSFYVTPKESNSDEWYVRVSDNNLPCGHNFEDQPKRQDFNRHVNFPILDQGVLNTKKKSVNCSPAGGSVVCTEQDSLGNYVIDIFIGYSNDAVSYLGGGALYQNHAATQVQTVNQALANSQIDSVYLRLVGTAVKNHNSGINLTSTGLDYVPTLFENEMVSSGADYICMFQEYYNTNSSNTAGGWATVQGRNSICMVEDNNVFRHEIGHNFGSNHCSGGSSGYSFANGYDNGYERTIMCGNDIAYYSTTSVNVNGRSIGTAFNDNARLLKERKNIIARHATHRVAFHSNDPCFNPGVVAIDFPIHIPPLSGDRIERVEIGSIDNSSTDAICEDVLGYSDYRSISTSHLRGDQISFTVTNGWNWAQSQSHMWIDWNSDGIFQSSELIAHTTGSKLFTGTITVPQSISLGPKVLRIRREYANSPFTPHPINSANYSGGETEDYTLNVYSAVGAIEYSNDVQSFAIVPNPVHSHFQIIGPYSSLEHVVVSNSSGSEIQKINLVNGQVFEMPELSPGLYFLSFIYEGAPYTLKFIKYGTH